MTTPPSPKDMDHLQDVEHTASNNEQRQNDTRPSEPDPITPPSPPSSATQPPQPISPPLVTQTAKELREVQKQEMTDLGLKSNPLSKKRSKKPVKDAPKSEPLSPASQLAHDFFEKDAAETLRECVADVYQKGLEKWRAYLEKEGEFDDAVGGEKGKGEDGESERRVSKRARISRKGE
ncbi:MAG: hypothetical protein Q9181_001514 [Wetmoreana brouardii]